MSSQDSLSLDQLAETYEVIGEMSGREDARTFMAKRLADGADVQIAVAQTPAGDEGNALSHLAADVNLLSGRVHRNLLPILEGRWLGTDAFAIVSERVDARSLGESLARREEQFDFPRIAMILQEVNGLLEWARSQKVVHRAIGLNTLYLEPGSDRVFVSFVVRPLPLADMPGAEEDARTIAQLARAMLTRSAAAPERADLPLAELRPGLSARVIEQTEELLALSRLSPTVPDVRGYIAVIAMADPLKRGETEFADTTRKLLEEERVAREEIEARRQSCERTAAEQQRLFEREKEAYAKEKASIERAFLKEKEATQRAFAKEAEAAQQAIAKEKEAIAKERALIARELAEVAEERAALQEQHDMYATTAEVRTPVGDQVPIVVPLSGAKRRSIQSPRARWSLPNWSRPSWNRAWNVPVAAASVLLLIIAVSLLALGRSRKPAPTSASIAIPAANVVESAAGAVATDTATRSDSTPAPIGVPADLVSGVATRAAMAPPIRPRPRPRPVVAPVDTTRAIQPDTMPRIGPLTPLGARTRNDSLVRPRPDSIARRDSVPRRDTIPRDTLIRRNTTGTRPQ